MGKAIKPITKVKHKIIRFTTFDLEAFGWINFLCVGFYDGHQNFYIHFDCMSRFINFAFSYCEQRNIENCFAHFGGKYDFNFTLRELFEKLKDAYECFSFIERGSGLLSFSVTRKGYDTDKKFKLTFRDSSAMLPFGLASIAKAMQVETQKGECDFRFFRQIWNNEDYTKELFAHKTEVNTDGKSKTTSHVKSFKVFYKDVEIKKYHPSLEKEFITYIDLVEKSDKIYKINSKDDLLFYMQKDCIALWQSLSKYFSWSYIIKAGPSFTIAGQSMKIWQTFLKEEIPCLTGSEEDFVRESYFGGRTEPFKTVFCSKPEEIAKNNFTIKEKEEFKKHEKNEWLYYYDANSLYPTVMKSNEFPGRCLGFFGADDYDPKGLGIWDVTVYVPKSLLIPPLGINHTFEDNSVRFIFPTGEFRGSWTVYEIEYAKSIGVTVKKIHNGLKFESAGFIFKEFIETMYKERLKAKENGDKVTDLLTKLVMNSTYGKIGMNIMRENLTIDDYVTEGVKPHSEIYDSNGDLLVRFVKEQVTLSRVDRHVAISSYVTSYGRVFMHKNAWNKVGFDSLFYGDTDSLFTTKQLEVGKQLGDFKLESKWKSACFLLPKTYMLEDGIDYDKNSDGEFYERKPTMKGFDRKKIKHFTFDDFFDYLYGELDTLGIKQDVKFASLKLALKRGGFVDLLFDSARDQMKDEQNMLTWDIQRQEIIKYGDEAEKMWLAENKKPKMKKQYDESFRVLKSPYIKRMIDPDNIVNTYPIHLGGSNE